MHKQPYEGMKIIYYDIQLDDEFPVYYFKYVQKYKDFHKLHYHNSFEIGLCLEGSGMFFIENRALSFNTCDISFIYPNQPHIAQSPNELPSKWLYINVDFDGLFLDNGKMSTILWENKNQIPYIIHSNDNLVKIASIIADELESKGQNYKLIIKELFHSFIYTLIRQAVKRDDNPFSLSEAYFSIAPALVYISHNYHNDISVTDLAKACNLSDAHFRLIFKNEIGCSPLQYLITVRMKMAKILLKSTELPVLIIAQKVGYTSISSFNRAFKSHFNQTPTVYRVHE